MRGMGLFVDESKQESPLTTHTLVSPSMIFSSDLITAVPDETPVPRASRSTSVSTGIESILQSASAVYSVPPAYPIAIYGTPGYDPYTVTGGVCPREEGGVREYNIWG